MLNKKRFTHLIQKRPRKAKHILLLALFLMAFSQSFAQYEMKKYTINNGGASMTGGSFELKSSIGQVDASLTLSNGNFQLNGGFWQENNDLIFKNNFENL